MLWAATWGGLAATSLLVGHALAVRGLSARATGLVMGVGSGALLGAIAYELVPESQVGGIEMPVAFLLGALAFFVGDWLVDDRGGSVRKDLKGRAQTGGGAAIFVGTLLDAVPESIILGMGLAAGGTVSVAFMAAVFVSNLPEGAAGSLNLSAAGHSQRQIFWMWGSLVALSAVCAWAGYGVAVHWSGADAIYAQAFAAGAMLTMLADVMMPEAFEHGGKTVGLVTVVGFLVAATLSVAR